MNWIQEIVNNLMSNLFLMNNLLFDSFLVYLVLSMLPIAFTIGDTMIREPKKNQNRNVPLLLPSKGRRGPKMV